MNNKHNHFTRRITRSAIILRVNTTQSENDKRSLKKSKLQCEISNSSGKEK